MAEKCGNISDDDLEFKGYGRDLLARVFEEKFAHWGLATSYVFAFIALEGFAYLALWYSHGGEVDNILYFGGYGALIAYIVLILVVGWFGAILYLRISRKAGAIYRELAQAGVIDPKEPKFRELVTGKSESVQRTHEQVRWPLLAVGITVLASALLVYSLFLDTHRTKETMYREIEYLFDFPVWIVGIYVITMTLTRALITVRGLYKLFGLSAQLGNVKVHPLHPDGCGGLTKLRDYALDLSYLVAILGMALALFGYVSSQVVPSGHVHADWHRAASFPIMWIGAIAYLILAPLTFFGTLGAAHGPMKRFKQDQLESISGEFSNEYDTLCKNLSGHDTSFNDRVDRVNRLRELHKITEAFPVWPWDWTSIRRFSVAVSAPFAVPLITGVR